MKSSIEQFDTHVAEYEEWFDQYPYVFQSEVEALREMLPEGDRLSGIEIGLGTGQYAKALGIKQGIEPSAKMRAQANLRGIETIDAVAERLPYGDLRFDFVLMAFCISYFTDMREAFKEAFRVLKKDGALVIGFIDKESIIGKTYEARKATSVFYKNASFYSVDQIKEALKGAGFRHLEFRQTLFGELDLINSLQHSQEGVGEGSFVVLKALKRASELSS